MKLLFSEAQADYSRYLYPYVVWGIPEAGEVPADLFNAGFLPGARGLDQFYLCRNIRVDLSRFAPSSENRRILRKGAGISMRLVPRVEFDFTEARKAFCLRYAEARYGKDVMPPARLESVFSPPLATHLLVFTEDQAGPEIGFVLLYLDSPRVAFYRYSFYDLNHPNRSLGLFLMTSAVEYFAAQGFQHLYLGTCYSERALYKWQFAGVEFFNGFRWSQDFKELKHQLRCEARKHLLEEAGFLDSFYDGRLEKISASGGFSVKLSGR